MTTIQNLKLKTLRLVLSCLNTYRTILGSLPGFQENYTKLENSVKTIDSANEQQLLAQKGLSDQKDNCKKVLRPLVWEVLSKLVSLANNTSNIILLQEVNYTKSQIKRLGDQKLKNLAQVVYNLANEHKTELEPYLVDAVLLKALSDAMENFNNCLVKPKEGQNTGKYYTQKIADQFKESETILKNLDIIAETLLTSNPEFYQNYKNSRKALSGNSTGISLKVKVKDAETDEGVEGATAAIALYNTKKAAVDSKSEVIKKRTAKKGGFNIKSLAAATYQVTITKLGYVEQVLTININDGEMTYTEIVLPKS
jgi:hypothetical protein